MNIKIGESNRSKEEWLIREENELSELEKEVVQIIHKWNNNAPIFYLTTSGSTGHPKEIGLTRELLKWSAKNTFDYLELKHEKLGCCLPLNKAGGFMMLIRSLIYNCDIHIVEPTANPLLLLDEDCTFVSLVPYQMIEILKNEKSQADLNGVNKILLGGAAIPSGLQGQLKLLKTAVYFGYGMTETASHIALMRIRNGNTNIGFDLLPGVEIAIKEKGQIAISLPQFGLKLATNDIGKIEKGQLRIIGRTEDYINSGGLKMHISELEEIIEKVMTLEKLTISFVVIGLPHSSLGEAISVVTEKEEIIAIIRHSINLEIESKLGSKYKIVNWKRVMEFPFVNHKIDRRGLRGSLGEGEGKGSDSSFISAP